MLLNRTSLLDTSLILVIFWAALPVISQGQPIAIEKLVAKKAQMKLVASDFIFTEGPAVDALGQVYFTDQPNNRIHRWDTEGNVSVFMENAGRANGLYFDREGNLLACADEHNQLWKISPDLEVTVLVDRFDGNRLNGPNDLWVDPHGGIYFTDPFYKRDYWSHSEKEIPQENLYYLSPGGNLRVVADDLVRPNGIVGTPDGKRLYVADIGDSKTYVYVIKQDGSLIRKTLFAEMGSDGMTLDDQGNVYLTGQGVTVFDKNGNRIGNIPVDERWTANICFGGPKGKTLFITAMKSVYTLEMQVKGVQ